MDTINRYFNDQFEYDIHCVQEAQMKTDTPHLEMGWSGGAIMLG